MFRRNHFLMSELGGESGAGGAETTTTETETEAAPEPTPAPAGVVIPDNWKDSIPEEFRNDKNMEHIKSVEDMAKSYINAQKHMGADKIVIPNQYSTEEDWGNIYNKLGRPETAEGYELSLGEDAKLSAGALTELKSKAHEVGILPNQLKALVEWQDTQLKLGETSLLKGIENRNAEAISTLKTEWGEDYNRRLQVSQALVSEFGGDDLKKYLNETGYGDDPKLIQTFFKIAQGMGEGRFKGDDNTMGSGFSPKGAADEANKLRVHPAYMDGNHPEHSKIVAEISRMTKLAHPDLGERK